MRMKSGIQSVGSPDRISTYFRQEIGPLALVTVSGIFYNIGMTAGPYFEGQLAQKLLEVMQGTAARREMLTLAAVYLAVILVVQGMRCVKRFYVRRFANDTARSMRRTLYNTLVFSKPGEHDDMGALMTKAVADVDACAEGMRKFTTEIFDTGVVMAAYLVMLLIYDWRLTLLSCLFTPAAYVLAQKLKKTVVRFTSAGKESAGRLNNATMARVEGALTYRVFGCDGERNARYEEALSDYEHRAVLANLWESTLQPLYHIIAMTGVLCILYFGGRNVAGTGWTVWNIASFTTFLSCFAKLAMKSSKAAKLFNAVQKARVSWGRIRPLMQEAQTTDTRTRWEKITPVTVKAEDVSFRYPGGEPVLTDVCFESKPGQIWGITGPVASGKSTLGGLFQCELPYAGHLTLSGQELSGLSDWERSQLIAVQNHDPYLISDTVEENIRMGETRSVLPYLEAVRLRDEVEAMPQGIHTPVGGGGVRLSGGQQARLALARALYAQTPVLVLDDPFSAVDSTTEGEIFRNLRKTGEGRTVLLISHRLTRFPDTDGVLWVEQGRVTVSDHNTLLRTQPDYARMYRAQTAGGESCDGK